MMKTIDSKLQKPINIAAGDNGHLFTRTITEYDEVWGTTKVQTYDYHYKVQPQATQSIEYDSLGRNAMETWAYDGKVEILSFSGYQGESKFDQTIDMTSWSNEKLTQFAQSVKTMHLSQEPGATELTLNKSVITKLFDSKEVNIFGDRFDTLNFNSDIGLTKAPETKNIGANAYGKYTANIDGTEYNFWIDNDITVNLG